MSEGKKRIDAPPSDPMVRAAFHTTVAGNICRAAKEILPESVGCLVLTFDYGEPGDGGRMGYAATGKREQVIALLREFLVKFEGN